MQGSLLALFLLLTITVYTELHKGKIYNWLTLPAILLGLFLGLLEGGVPLLLERLWAMLIGAGILFIPYLISGIGRGKTVIGGGDVKLMGAIGALTGIRFTLWSMYYGVLIGAGLGFVIIMWWVLRKRKESIWILRIPFGTALSTGAICAFFFKF